MKSGDSLKDALPWLNRAVRAGQVAGQRRDRRGMGGLCIS